MVDNPLTNAISTINSQQSLLDLQKKQLNQNLEEANKLQSKIPEASQQNLRQGVFSGLAGMNRAQQADAQNKQIEDYKQDINQYKEEVLDPAQAQVNDASQKLAAYQEAEKLYANRIPYELLSGSDFSNPYTYQILKSYYQNENLAKESQAKLANEIDTLGTEGFQQKYGLSDIQFDSTLKQAGVSLLPITMTYTDLRGNVITGDKNFLQSKMNEDITLLNNPAKLQRAIQNGTVSMDAVKALSLNNGVDLGNNGSSNGSNSISNNAISTRLDNNNLVNSSNNTSGSNSIQSRQDIQIAKNETLNFAKNASSEISGLYKGLAELTGRNPEYNNYTKTQTEVLKNQLAEAVRNNASNDEIRNIVLNNTKQTFNKFPELKDALIKTSIGLGVIGTGAGALAGLGISAADSISSIANKIVDAIAPQNKVTEGQTPSSTITRQLERGALFTGLASNPIVGTAFLTSLVKSFINNPSETYQQSKDYISANKYEFLTGLALAAEIPSIKQSLKSVSEQTETLAKANERLGSSSALNLKDNLNTLKETIKDVRVETINTKTLNAAEPIRGTERTVLLNALNEAANKDVQAIINKIKYSPYASQVIKEADGQYQILTKIPKPANSDTPNHIGLQVVKDSSGQLYVKNVLMGGIDRTTGQLNIVRLPAQINERVLNKLQEQANRNLVEKQNLGGSVSKRVIEKGIAKQTDIQKTVDTLANKLTNMKIFNTKAEAITYLNQIDIGKIILSDTGERVIRLPSESGKLIAVDKLTNDVISRGRQEFYTVTLSKEAKGSASGLTIIFQEGANGRPINVQLGRFVIGKGGRQEFYTLDKLRASSKTFTGNGVTLKLEKAPRYRESRLSLSKSKSQVSGNENIEKVRTITETKKPIFSEFKVKEVSRENIVKSALKEKPMKKSTFGTSFKKSLQEEVTVKESLRVKVVSEQFEKEAKSEFKNLEVSRKQTGTKSTSLVASKSRKLSESEVERFNIRKENALSKKSNEVKKQPITKTPMSKTFGNQESKLKTVQETKVVTKKSDLKEIPTSAIKLKNPRATPTPRLKSQYSFGGAKFTETLTRETESSSGRLSAGMTNIPQKPIEVESKRSVTSQPDIKPVNKVEIKTQYKTNLKEEQLPSLKVNQNAELKQLNKESSLLNNKINQTPLSKQNQQQTQQQQQIQKQETKLTFGSKTVQRNTNQTPRPKPTERKPPFKPKPRIQQLQNNDEANKKKLFTKNVKTGYDVYVKEKGKFVRVNEKPLAKIEQAYGEGFGVARSDLSRSVIAVKTNREAPVSKTLAQANYNKLKQAFRPSKKYGAQVQVEINALATRPEVNLIQKAKKEASKNKPFYKKVGAPKIMEVK